jgi:hypothetical protein
MPINLPTINDARFLGMTACGRLRPDRPNFGQIFDRPKPWGGVAEVGSGQDRLILGTHWGTKGHIHIDYVRKDEYGDTSDSEQLRIEEIQDRLNRIVGEPISGTFLGRYRLPLSVLPERGLINASRFGFEHGQLSITMSGGELAIEGAPIQSLNWRIKKNSDIVIDLKGKMDTMIDHDYLIRYYDLLNQCLDILVLARVGNADL